MEFLLNKNEMAPFLDRLRNKEPSLVVAIGDSNTGNFWFTGGGKQWPELLQTELRCFYGGQFTFLFNAGICGETIIDANARLERDALRYRPDLVIIAFASNDWAKVKPEEFTGTLTTSIERIRKIGSQVLLRTVPPLMEKNPEPFHIWKGNPALPELNRRVRATAEKFKLPFVDIYGMWEKLEAEGKLSMAEIMSDEAHTNARGHQLIARQLMPIFGLPETFHFER